MKRGALAMAMLLVACSRPDATSNGIATDDGIAAIALPEEQYRDMLKRGVLVTQSGAIHIGALGLDKGCAVLDDAVEKVVQEHLPQWRANLIAAYRENVPADRLAEAVEKSPRRAHSMLESYMPAIGSAMKERSQPLLESSGVEVLQATGAAASKVDRKSTNLADRQKELDAVKASGKICGVGKWQRQ